MIANVAIGLAVGRYSYLAPLSRYAFFLVELLRHLTVSCLIPREVSISFGLEVVMPEQLDSNNLATFGTRYATHCNAAL